MKSRLGKQTLHARSSIYPNDQVVHLVSATLHAGDECLVAADGSTGCGALLRLSAIGGKVVKRLRQT